MRDKDSVGSFSDPLGTLNADVNQETQRPADLYRRDTERERTEQTHKGHEREERDRTGGWGDVRSRWK